MHGFFFVLMDRSLLPIAHLCFNPGPLQGASILEGKFDPAFPLKHAQKDMRFAVVRGVLVE